MAGKNVRHAVVAFVAGIFVDVVCRVVEDNLASVGRGKTARIIGSKLILNCIVADSG